MHRMGGRAFVLQGETGMLKSQAADVLLILARVAGVAFLGGAGAVVLVLLRLLLLIYCKYFIFTGPKV